jgi:hypothetical protein
MRKPKEDESLTESEIADRMTRAVKRSLQMPPKPHKTMRKPRQKKTVATASDAKSETPSG